MPVFTRLRDGVLEVIVDGDYTSGELRRARASGLQSEDVPTPVPVLLDMSGAAGVDRKSEEELRETGELFGEHPESIARLGVLAPPAAAFVIEDAADAAGVETRPFGTRSEAMDWLRSPS